MTPRSEHRTLAAVKNMDPIFVHGSDRAFIIEERTRSWVDTTTGSRHYGVRHCSSGSLLWGLWERTSCSPATHRYITCDLLVGSRSGWGYRAMLESDELQYLSCPEAYLRESTIVSEHWRARVAAYWRTPLRTGPRVRKIQSNNQRGMLQEGDRVRFIRGNSDASLGTVTAVVGSAGPTLHADELCRTTFVKWDDGRMEPVFTSRLEHVEVTALAGSRSQQQ